MQKPYPHAPMQKPMHPCTAELVKEADALKQATAGMHAQHEGATGKLNAKRLRLKDCDTDIAGGCGK